MQRSIGLSRCLGHVMPSSSSLSRPATPGMISPVYEDFCCIISQATTAAFLGKMLLRQYIPYIAVPLSNITLIQQEFSMEMSWHRHQHIALYRKCHQSQLRIYCQSPRHQLRPILSQERISASKPMLQNAIKGRPMMLMAIVSGVLHVHDVQEMQCKTAYSVKCISAQI